MAAELLDEYGDPDTRTNQEYLEDEVIPLIDYDETRYPVVVEVTESKIVWVVGDSPEHALERLKNDPDWYEHVDKNEPAFDFAVNFDEVPSWAWSGSVFQHAVYTDEIGPRWQCPHCPHGGFHPSSVIHMEWCVLRKPQS